MGAVITCRRCGSTITSDSRHDLQFCSCSAVGIDGGDCYTRIIGDRENYQIVVPAPMEITAELLAADEYWLKPTADGISFCIRSSRRNAAFAIISPTHREGIWLCRLAVPKECGGPV